MELATIPFQLEPITLKEYRKIEQQWGDEKAIPSQDLCARLVNPLKSETYLSLFEMFSRLPKAKRFHVRQGLHWRRVSMRDLTPAVMRQIAEIASRDPKKRNYLELLIGNGDKRGRIEFAESGQVVVGYKLHVFRDARELFSIPPYERWYRAVHALYDKEQ